jgi:hypothetical protein
VTRLVADGRDRLAEFAEMQRLTRIFFILVFAAVAAGIVFLAAWDMPPPSAPVEKVIPNERFSR